MSKAYRFRVTATDRRTGKVPPEFRRPWLRELVDVSQFAAYVGTMREFTKEFPGYRFSLELVAGESLERAA